MIIGRMIRFIPRKTNISLCLDFENYAKSGNKIFDSHLGSGSNRIAAYKLGFDFYATEIDKDYLKHRRIGFDVSVMEK